MKRPLLAAASIFAFGSFAAAGPDLEAPRRLEAKGAPIDVDIGHAAPLVVDWNGDGKKDLLVGQFGEGKLRIYLNAGTDAAPKYEEPTWFEAGGQVAKIPSG